MLTGCLLASVLHFGVAKDVFVELGSLKPTHVSPRMGIYRASISSIDLQFTWVFIMRSNVSDGNVSPINVLA